MDPVEDWHTRSLEYHRLPRPGKISVVPTKPVSSSNDLSLAYTPGVATPCLEIKNNPATAFDYTNKGNLVGIITDGSAVLGLGNIGPLASKPVMEGKAVLFKRFAGIDAFDIEVNAPTPESFIETVANISLTFGGINLEDIRAPKCFYIEQRLRERVSVPVMHDDQWGTAVVTCAGLHNALKLQKKRPDSLRIVAIGAGAASIASLKLASEFFGLSKEQITVIDSKGVVSAKRRGLPDYKRAFAPEQAPKDLKEAAKGADVILGFSLANQITTDMVKGMAERPIIFALANPIPEIMPDKAKSVRQDLVIATGRSDFPNQVNNSICFPYLFRAALDVRATRFTQAMQFASVLAIADLAEQPIDEEVLVVDKISKDLRFGPGYILPKQFDPRLRKHVVSAIIDAHNAEKSGSESADTGI